MKYFIILLTLLGPIHLYSNTGTVFTLPEALAYGLAHSPEAQNARLDENIAKTRIGQAASLALPQLSANASYTRAGEVASADLDEGPVALGSEDNYEVSAGISQLLYAGGQVGAAWRAARLTREIADASRQATESSLTFRITRQFYLTILAKENLKVQESSQYLLRALEKQIRDRERGGAASAFDALSAKVRVANGMPALIAARNQLAQALTSLATLIHFKESLDIEGELQVIETDWDLATLQAMAREHRREYQIARLQKDLAKEAVVNTQSEGRPEIRLFANAIGGNANQMSFSDDWDWNWNAGLSASWNIWDGNLTRQMVRQRELEYTQQQNLVEQTDAMIHEEVETAWLTLVQAREALAASAETVTLATQALEIAKARYDSGLSTYLELTDANLALRTAELARLQATHDHAVAKALLRFTTGMPTHVLMNVPKHADNATNHPDEK